MPKGEKGGVDEKIRFEFLKIVNSTISEQIRLADTKAAWTFSVLGLLTAVLTNILTKYSLKELLVPRVMVFGIIAIGSLILAFKHIVLVMYPRISKGTKGGVIYFRDVTQSTKEEYIELLESFNEERMAIALNSQTWELSRIAEKKFASLRTAIISCMFALGWIVVTAIMLT